MPTPSPLVLVADGAGPFNPTFPDGLDINPGDVVSVVLQSPSGVTNWYLQIGLVIGNPPVVVPGTGLDELTVTPPPLTGVNGAGLVTGGPTSTVTFTFPNAQGRTLLFSSTVTGGFGSITTTFALFSLTSGGYRVGATGMSREGSNDYGWTKIVNPAIRQIGTGSGVTQVTGSTPIASSGGTTPNISFSIAGQQAGDLVYLNSVGWTRLAKGSTGQFLQAGTTGPDFTPSWVTAVTSVGGSSPISSTGGATPTLSFFLTGQTQGDIVYFNGSNWVRLPAGTSGQFLKTLGPGFNPQWDTASGSAAPVGDNADAARMGPDRPFLMDGQFVSLGIQIRNAGLNDGAGGTWSGADLVISERRLLFTGRQGINFAQLYSIDLAGHQTGLDYDLTSSIATLKNPSALIGMGVETSFFNTFAVGNAGAVSNYIYESVHSTAADVNIVWTAGAEDWSGSRACFVFTTQRNASFGNSFELFFTAPLADKFYQGNIYNDAGDPTGYTFTGETPTGICAAGDNTFWVSFVGSGKLRKYQVNTPGTYPTITQVGTDISLTGVLELLFDGKYLWALSTDGGPTGTIYKLDADGSLIDSFAFTSGTVSNHSRMCFDGTSIWITRATVVNRIFPEGKIAVQMEILSGGDARGIVCDPIDKTIYVAVSIGDALRIFAWIPPTGELWRTRERQATWQTNQHSMPTSFVAVDMTTNTIACTRQFEFSVSASQISGGTSKAAWKKYVAVDDDGTNMTIIGSVADVVPPMLNAGAVTNAFDVSVTSTGTNLQVTIDQGSLAGGLGVNWTINIKEIRSFAGAL
jgi:hypothetical protein